MFKVLIQVILSSGLALMIGACSSGSDSTVPQKTEFLTFITKVTPDGDIKTAGGLSNAIASADNLCNIDANKPNGSTYKAMLVDGVNRVACITANCTTGGMAEHKDWVFQVNAKYFRSDGTTLIFRTNANGVFDFGPGGNTNFLISSFGNSGYAYWTGMDMDWTSLTTQMCGGAWANNSSVNIGAFGNDNRLDSGSMSGGTNVCNLNFRLLCVEQ